MRNEGGRTLRYMLYCLSMKDIIRFPKLVIAMRDPVGVGGDDGPLFKASGSKLLMFPN